MTQSTLTLVSVISALLICILTTAAQSGESLPINVVIIIIGDNPAYGYYVQAPAYDASFTNLQLTYPNVTAKVNRYMIHKPGNFTCSEAAAVMTVVSGEIDVLIRQLNGTTIIISPGCSLEIIALGDFARGMVMIHDS